MNPCRCWTTSPPLPHQGHCCFMDDETPLEEIKAGEPPTCGHWVSPDPYNEDIPQWQINALYERLTGQDVDG